MNILAFDTCFGACSVAVRKRTARGEVIVREEYEERATGHAEALIPMMQRVMDAAQLEFRDLDRIAVTDGPGSFTGVRIGVSTARGLALALDKPIVAMTSLMVMALRADHLVGAKRTNRVLAVCVDARKGQIYAQLFGENGGDALCEPQLVTPHEVVQQFEGRPFLGVGSGAKAVVDAVEAAYGASPVGEHALPALEPHARWLAVLAPGLTPRTKLSPLYLRPPDAKPQVTHINITAADAAKP